MLSLAKFLVWAIAMLPHIAHPLPPAAGAVRVYAAHDYGVTCFRIPAVVQTASGTLLAFAEARYNGCQDWQARRIAVRRSVDGGVTWSNITFAAGDGTQRTSNPYPIALSSGRVMLTYVKYSGHVANRLVFSDDDGETWGYEVDVSDQFGAARGCAPGPGSGIEVELGAQARRLVVVSHRSSSRGAFVTYSDDGGESWQTVPEWFPGMDESTVADLGGGHILISMRNAREDSMGRAVARSTDGGLTWSDVSFDRTLVGKQCEGSLTEVNGAVYFSNPASRTLRHRLTVRRSDDGGLTWGAQMLLWVPITGGYSSLVRGALGDGTRGGILYESSKSGDIDFATFPLNLAPPDSDPGMLV